MRLEPAALVEAWLTWARCSWTQAAPAGAQVATSCFRRALSMSPVGSMRTEEEEVRVSRQATRTAPLDWTELDLYLRRQAAGRSPTTQPAAWAQQSRG